MPSGGIVRIESRFLGDKPGKRTFEFIVSDTGGGMDTLTAARAFDPFFSTKSSSRGTGLPTIKAIIEAAGGDISTESSPGLGTRMIVHLPEVPENRHSDQTPHQLGRSTKKQSEDRGATQ